MQLIINSPYRHTPFLTPTRHFSKRLSFPVLFLLLILIQNIITLLPYETIMLTVIYCALSLTNLQNFSLSQDKYIHSLC